MVMGLLWGEHNFQEHHRVRKKKSRKIKKKINVIRPFSSKLLHLLIKPLAPGGGVRGSIPTARPGRTADAARSAASRRSKYIDNCDGIFGRKENNCIEPHGQKRRDC